MRDVPKSTHRQAGKSGLSRMRQFSLMSIRQADRMVVRACGRLVLGHGAHRRLWASHLGQGAATDVALDLSCVNDVDAKGLGVLAELTRRARQRGRTLSVIAASRVVQRLGEMTLLERALPGRGMSGSEFSAVVLGKRGRPECILQCGTQATTSVTRVQRRLKVHHRPAGA